MAKSADFCGHQRGPRLAKTGDFSMATGSVERLSGHRPLVDGVTESEYTSVPRHQVIAPIVRSGSDAHDRGVEVHGCG
jgi:hypothetical protein